MAGVNPHAGEDGALGREEIDMSCRDRALKPKAGMSRAEIAGHDVSPRPRNYDVAICHYHDQALIP